MARQVKSAKLETPTARKSKELEVRDKPHYVVIAKGLHLGYRKGKRAGKWVARCFIEGSYDVTTFARADDELTADGSTVLDYWQAQERARAIYRDKTRVALGIEEPSKAYTVADCMADYLEYMEAHTKGAHDARNRINAFILPELGSVEVTKLTTARINRWLRHLAEQPPRVRTRAGEPQKYREVDFDDPDAKRRRQASANRTFTYLKAALNQAWRDRPGLIDDIQWLRVRPFRKVNVARVGYLTVPEAKRLLNASEPDFRDLVHGALTTGCRYGELTRMKIADFDPDNGQVFVGLSKSGNTRHVVLNHEGLELFNRLTAGRPDGAAIFRKANGKRWGRAHQGLPFAEAKEAAKITKDITFHSLRHTYASLSIMNGAEPLVVAHNLGHSDTRMVERHYGHLAQAYKAKRIRATAPVFGISEGSNVERLGARS